MHQIRINKTAEIDLLILLIIFLLDKIRLEM